MPFRIRRDEVSNRSWGDVDKTALRNRLVRGLEEGVEGVRDAIREVYAVIRADDLADAPSQNWWGPHHEVRENGDVVLNVNGLVAAAQALAGARAEPDLTPEQRRAAAPAPPLPRTGPRTAGVAPGTGRSAAGRRAGPRGRRRVG